MLRLLEQLQEEKNSFLLQHLVSSRTAGQMIQSHIQGNRCLIVTNDRIAPMFLEKYQTVIQAAGGDRLKVGTSFFFLDM